MIPKSMPSDLIRWWKPVSRLREARFGGRRKVGKDYAPAKCNMTRSRHRIRTAALAVLPVLLLAGAAAAQEQRSSPGFLDNLFSRGEQREPQGQSQVEVRRG